MGTCSRAKIPWAVLGRVLPAGWGSWEPGSSQGCPVMGRRQAAQIVRKRKNKMHFRRQKYFYSMSDWARAEISQRDHGVSFLGAIWNSIQIVFLATCPGWPCLEEGFGLGNLQRYITVLVVLSLCYLGLLVGWQCLCKRWTSVELIYSHCDVVPSRAHCSNHHQTASQLHSTF